MYGPGTGSGSAPPPIRPDSRGVAIGLRVIFTALPVVSFGMLAWVSALRLALLRRRPRDWVLLAVSVGLSVVGVVLSGVAKNEQTWQSNTGVTFLLVNMFGTAAYFLVTDIRRGALLFVGRAPAGYAPPHPYAAGIPQPRRSPYGYGPPGPVAPAMRLPPPPPPRINQVRAELEELSDYLRKEEGK